ncbi:MAG: ABC transporter ATP-binding protein [Coprobacillaceae bacterium]
METLLTFENISYHYQDGMQKVSILDKANYNFEKGKIYAIVGASGSGKTTTIALAGGLDVAKEGDVRFNNESVEKIGLGKYRQKYVSIVFQSYNLIHYMNALDNVINAMNIAKMAVPNKKEYALEVLASLGLSEDESTRSIQKLSGGQQQRVAIARAIAKDVDLILADEPTGNLDKKNANAIIGTFIKLAHENEKCVILVTHSNSIANRCDVQLKIKEGQIVEI